MSNKTNQLSLQTTHYRTCVTWPQNKNRGIIRSVYLSLTVKT